LGDDNFQIIDRMSINGVNGQKTAILPF